MFFIDYLLFFFIGAIFGSFIHSFVSRQSLKLDSSKIFKDHIYLLDEDHEFNKDKKISRWSTENNIAATIYRPDQHIYGCVGHENVVNDIDKLTHKLIDELI